MWLVEKEEGLVMEVTEWACAGYGVAGGERGGASVGGDRVSMCRIGEAGGERGWAVDGGD